MAIHSIIGGKRACRMILIEQWRGKWNSLGDIHHMHITCSIEHILFHSILALNRHVLNSQMSHETTPDESQLRDINTIDSKNGNDAAR